MTDGDIRIDYRKWVH